MLEQLQLVPFGGDAGPEAASTELKFSVIYIRVQCPAEKLRGASVFGQQRFEHGKLCLDFIRKCK
jgi:hypothetical protein